MDMDNHRLTYSPDTLRSIRSHMTDFELRPRVFNRLKELNIVRRRRGARAGIQEKLKHTKASNFSFPYGFSSNINSLYGKFIHLEQTVGNMPNLCFIALQETKLQTVGNKWEGENVQHQVADEALQMQNFHMFRQDRGFTANGGGLMTYISKDWSINTPKVCFTLSTPDIELIAVRAHPRFLPSDISKGVEPGGGAGGASAPGEKCGGAEVSFRPPLRKSENPFFISQMRKKSHLEHQIASKAR
ncbi:hypothetical protein BSL78_13809 [Apostichopus japonicus]|uniref:Uncharacterized protein n=1 Tax=Stichopus japonicus TaxID=307972 RepID=A0A2G8KMP5_STIJA|nr:hypothetical protein BSL78_13809 [Apostichopus japonicus]